MGGLVYLLLAMVLDIELGLHNKIPNKCNKNKAKSVISTID